MQLPLMIRSPLAVSLIIASVTFFAAYQSLKGGNTNNSQPAESQLTTQASSDGFEVELVTLRPFGFEPAELTRPRGAFGLFVDDRTGRESSTLSLMRLNGDRQKEVRTSRKKSEWHDLIDLAPGDYVLVDTANPESSCRITIVP